MISMVATSLLLAVLAGVPPAAGPLQRYTLVIGANDGGQNRPKLQYAISDAERFARVMAELGGVAPANEILLRQPTLAELLRAFDLVTARIAAGRRATTAAGGRTEVLVYYSGHADEQGLLIGEDRVSYRTLRDRLDDMAADVRIAVLDACASGAFTRLKGGRARPPFLVDASSVMRGHAFLTSSAETEAAQESDRLGASYFTHYLVSGLRGAADVSGDGRVTLGEAYQFAFTETLGRTVDTKGGAQHPSYDINLSGTGDVVMTDLRQTSATLVLAEDLDGRVFLRSPAREVVVELNKPHGRKMEIGLAPGTYDVRLEHDKSARQARTQLADGARVVLDARQFGPAVLEPTRRRGTAETSRGVATGANRFAMVSGIWGNSGNVVTIGRRGFDVFGGGQYSRYVRDDLAVTVGLDAYGAEHGVDIIGGLAVPVTVQWDPTRRWRGWRALNPFVSAGGVFVTRSDWFGSQRRRDSAFGMQVGAGADVYISRSFSVGLKAAFNAVPKLGSSGRPDNYHGLQLSMNTGWLFGSPR